MQISVQDFGDLGLNQVGKEMKASVGFCPIFLWKSSPGPTDCRCPCPGRADTEEEWSSCGNSVRLDLGKACFPNVFSVPEPALPEAELRQKLYPVYAHICILVPSSS